MLSEDNQKRSRSELRSLIISINKTKKQTKIKRNPKFRFRALVRTVINNLKWLMEDTLIDEKVSPKHPKLTIQNKGLLRVAVADRTVEEKDMLSKLMSHMQCFDRYPEKVRESLIASAMFDYFPPGRVLVAEGHPSVAMYFIISGQANVSKVTFDPGLKEYKSVDLAVMNAGDAFGEINILHDEPWPTTVTTLTHIEILTVLKEHFQRILEEFFGEQQREITKCLNQFTYFKDWTHRTVIECCILARIVKYDNDVLIIGDDCGDLEKSYFIVSGSCRVVYHMIVEQISRKGFTEMRILDKVTISGGDTFPLSDTVKGIERSRLRKIGSPFVTSLIVDKTLQQIVNELPLPESEDKERGSKVSEIQIQSHFLEIANLLPGACFGIGESLSNKFILSSSHPVTLLCIPKFFLQFHNVGNIWGRVRENFNSTYPSAETVFNAFIIDRKWLRSRSNYLESIIKVERPFTGLTQAEAPYHTRLTTDLENPIFCRSKKILYTEDGRRSQMISFKPYHN